MAAITNQPLSTITLDDPEVIQDAPVSTSIDYGDDWVDYTDNEYAKAIIVNRKILEAPFIPHDWKFFYDSKTNRLVIPWIRDGEMVYYQSRAIIKSPEKYLFPKNTEKDVFGLDTFDESVPYVFYSEGVFDAIWTKNCLAIGGLNLSKHQAEVVENRTCLVDHHVYFPDNQWLDHSARDATIKCVKAGKQVFIWPKEFKQKDVNDYVLKNKTNPFMDINFMSKHVYKGIAALTRLKFMR
jgi:DNA primase